MQARPLQKIAASDKYGATARTNLNALATSKFKAQSQRGMRKIYPELCAINFKFYGDEYGAPAPYQI